MTNAADALAVPCRVHVAWSRREPMAGIEIACNYLVQHRRDMLSACWRKLLILVASPAGFEPATCGLEIRCCYPTELRGRDGQAFTPRSPSSASAATAGFCRTTRRSAACADCRRRLEPDPKAGCTCFGCVIRDVPRKFRDDSACGRSSTARPTSAQTNAIRVI